MIPGKERQRLRHLGQLSSQKALIEKTWAEIELEKASLAQARDHHQMLVANEMAGLEAARNQLQQLIDNNNKIVKSNEVFLYSIKEGTLNTIKDYRRFEKLLGKVLFSDVEYGKLFGLLAGVQQKIANLEDYFSKTFRVTPDQYKAAKEVQGRDFTKN